MQGPAGDGAQGAFAATVALVEAAAVSAVLRAIHQAVLKVPASAWTPAVEPDGEIRDGAWGAELAGDCLTGRPMGLRLIVRKERPHPGAQLRFIDADGMRLICFATNTAGEAIAALELRHRQRARAEDRIRAARATGLRNLPLHDAAQNHIWLEIIQTALDLLAWMPVLALSGKGPTLGAPPPAAPPFLRRRPTRHHRPPPASYASPDTGPGPTRSPTPWSGSTPSRAPADQHLPIPASRTGPPEPWNPAPT